MDDYEKNRLAEKAAEKADHTKLVKALAILDIKPEKEEKGDYSSVRAKIGGHQSIYCRIESYGNKGKYNLNLSAVKEIKNSDMSIYDYKRIEINIAKTKTIEQIAKDIQKRILDSAEFTQNYAYIEKRIKEHQESKDSLNANKEFFSKSGLVFSDSKEKTNASIFKSLGSGNGYLEVEAHTSQDFNDCNMKLRGLDKETWEKVFKLIKPIVEACQGEVNLTQLVNGKRAEAY